MLPVAARLHTAGDFSAVMRSGRRASVGTLVVHAKLGPGPAGPRAGFVVSGKIGNSVVRHRITRRLRPLVRQELGSVPPGMDLVVRALPAAAAATSAELGRDLHTGLESVLRKYGRSRTAVEQGRS